MNLQELKLWEILVPYVMDGKMVPVFYHQKWDKKVIKITQGLTFATDNPQGKWLDKNGQISGEKMIPVRIACTEDQIKQIMELTLEHYEQEAIFVTLISKKVLILSKD